MNTKSIFFFFILNLLQYFSFAQNNTVDSLQAVLKIVKEDTTKVNTLNGLAYEFRNNNPDTAIYFANNALALATKLNFKMGVADSYLNLGSATISLGQFEDALKNADTSILVYDDLISSGTTIDKSKILRQKARAYTIAGNANNLQGNFSEAMKGYAASLKLRQEIGDKSGIASCYNNIGSVYLDEGNYPEALKMQLAGLRIREEINDKKGIAASYNNIGNVYDGMQNYPEALKNHYAALEIRKEIGDKQGIAQSYNNIGGINSTQGNYSEALRSNFESLKIREEIGDKSGMATSFASIGGTYMDQSNYPDALKNNFASLKISEEIGDKQSMAYAFIAIGNVFARQRKNNDVLGYFEKGLMLSKEMGNLRYIKDAYTGLATLDSAMGNYKEALEHYKLSVAYRDSLFNEANTKKLVQSQMQYDYDKKEAKAKAVQEKKDALASSEAKRQRTIRNSTFAGLAFLLIFSLVVYRQRNKISREKKRSDQLVVDKEMLIKEIHHRVKNNLQVISSLLELQSEAIDDSKAKAAVLEGQSRVQSIALIHHKLYRTDEVASVEFKSFVTDLYTQVESVFKKPNNEVEFKIIADETNISIDAAVPLGLIINELLTNTFKYAMGQNRKNIISITLGEGERESEGVYRNFKLVYRDNSPGLPAGYNLENSTSFGMKVIRLLTEQLGGSLNFYNDNGSVFEIPFHN